MKNFPPFSAFRIPFFMVSSTVAPVNNLISEAWKEGGSWWSWSALRERVRRRCFFFQSFRAAAARFGFERVAFLVEPLTPLSLLLDAAVISRRKCFWG